MTGPQRRRPRGEGSIYHTAAGRWRGAFVVTDPDTGIRTRRIVSAQTQAGVRERMAALKRDVAAGAKPGDRKTVAVFVAIWLPALRQRIRPASFRTQEQYCRLYIVPAVGALQLSQLTPAHVEKMTGGMVGRGLSPATARGARACLRALLGDAERDGVVTRNVASLARAPRLERREFRILTAAQTRALIEGTVDDELGPLIALAATTGMRQGEVLGLRWTDVDLDGAVLTVSRALARTAAGGFDLAEPKSKRSRRTLDLAPIAIAALRRQEARQAEARARAGDLWQDRHNLVFTDALGRPLRAQRVHREFSAALVRLGFAHVRFHDLRHGAASMMLNAGVPLKVVSESLGHSSIAITADTYGHLDHGQRKQTAEAMQRMIGGES